MKKLLTLFFIVFVSMLFVGCEPSEATVVESITLVDGELLYSEDFELADILIEVKMSDGTKSQIPLSIDMISNADFEKLKTTGNHQIKVKYLSTEQTLNISIRADETEFRVSDDYIQWKYKSETTWKNLVSLDDLKGANGSSPTITISEDDYWVIDGVKSTVKAAGEDGKDGEDGSSPEVTISVDGYWVIDDVKTTAKAVPDSGDETELRIDDNNIQWKYKTEEVWKNLISLNDLKGEAGASTSVTISEDGYWVLDGVKTTFKATPDPDVVVNYNVSYVLAGGVLSEGAESITLPSGSLIVLPEATKENNLFKGWYDEEGYQFTKYDTVNQDLVLYAKWEVIPSELEAFLTSFMSDNCTITLYKYYYEPEVDFYEEANRIKKSIVGDLVTYEYQMGVDNSFYFAYDDKYIYQMDTEYLDFEYEKYNKNIVLEEALLNTLAINPAYLDFYDGEYFGSLPETMVKELFNTNYDDFYEGYDNHFFEAYAMIDIENNLIEVQVYIERYGSYGTEYCIIYYDLYLSDIGTTETELPYWFSFEELESAAMEQRKTLTDDSQIIFDQLFSAMQADYLEVSNIQEYADMLEKHLSNDIELENDVKKGYFYELEYILEELSYLATAASIEEMELLYIEALDLIAGSNPLRAFAYYLEYRDLMNATREDDLDKIALDNEKWQARYDLEGLYSEISLFVRHFDSPILYERLNYYLDQVEQATTIEQLTPYYDQYYDEIEMMDLVPSLCLWDLKEYIEESCWDHYNYVSKSLKDLGVYIKNINNDYMNQFREAIYDSEDVFSLFERQPMFELSEFFSNSLYDYITRLEDIEYEYYRKRVIVSELVDLENNHQDFLDDAQENRDYYINAPVYTNVGSFVNLLNSYLDVYKEFILDEEKVDRCNYIDELSNYVEYLKHYGTDASLEAIEIIYLDALPELETAAYDDLLGIFELAYWDIRAAFVEDEDKTDYMTYKESYILTAQFINNFMSRLLNFSEWSNFNQMHLQLVEEIKAVSKFTELDALFVDHLQTISELSYEIQDYEFYDAIDSELYIIDECFLPLLVEKGISETSEEYLALVEIRNLIEEEYYIITVFELFLDFRIILDQAIIS